MKAPLLGGEGAPAGLLIFLRGPEVSFNKLIILSFRSKQLLKTLISELSVKTEHLGYIAVTVLMLT